MKNRSGDIRLQTLKMFSAFESTHHDNTADAVRDLISKVGESLSLPGQKPGVWETAELDDAAQALDAGFPKLALIAAGKALAVNQLSGAEYAFGFDFLHRRENILAERNSALAEIERLRTEAARELLERQKEAARALEQIQEKEAKQLESIQAFTAAALIDSQCYATFKLNEEEAHDAMVRDSAWREGFEKKRQEELEKSARLREQEQVLAWLSGGYSTEQTAFSLGASIAIDEIQEKAKLSLKERQNQEAATLKEKQRTDAVALREREKLEAEELKAEHKDAATRLRENQIIKALRKKSAE